MSLLIKNFFYKEQNWWDFGVCYIRSRLYFITRKTCYGYQGTLVDVEERKQVLSQACQAVNFIMGRHTVIEFVVQLCKHRPIIYNGH